MKSIEGGGAAAPAASPEQTPRAGRSPVRAESGSFTVRTRRSVNDNAIQRLNGETIAQRNARLSEASRIAHAERAFDESFQRDRDRANAKKNFQSVTEKAKHTESARLEGEARVREADRRESVRKIQAAEQARKQRAEQATMRAKQLEDQAESLQFLGEIHKKIQDRNEEDSLSLDAFERKTKPRFVVDQESREILSGSMTSLRPVEIPQPVHLPSGEDIPAAQVSQKRTWRQKWESFKQSFWGKKG